MAGEPSSIIMRTQGKHVLIILVTGRRKRVVGKGFEGQVYCGPINSRFSSVSSGLRV